MTTELLQNDLWDKINRLSKRARKRHLAVAYLGTGASDLLALQRGDTLITDLSLRSVRCGNTNPYEVEKYITNGVLVFNCSNLHAKIYVFDNTAVVGSCNLSFNSRDGLVEAGVLTSQPSVVQKALQFLKSLQVEPITPEYLKICKSEYKPPKFGGRARTSVRQIKRVSPTHSRLWLVGVSDVRFSEEEETIIDHEAARAVKSLRNEKQYEISSVRWIGESFFTRSARKGDLVIQFYDREVYPPSRIVRISKYRLDERKKTRFCIHLAEPKKPKLYQWSKFRKVLSGIGLKKVGFNSTREIKSFSASHELLGMW